MAYLQTTASSIDDICNSIATFSAGLGWTVERNNTFTSGANTRRILTLSRAGVDHAHFASELGTTKLTLHTMRSIGFTDGVDLLTQPNKSTLSTSNLLTSGPYVNMWLFGEGGANPYVHCVIEHAAGSYRHFGIGEIIKQGTWVGGSYCYGTFWGQSSVQIDAIYSTAHATPFSAATGIVGAHNGAMRCDNYDGTVNGLSGIDNRYLPYAMSVNGRVDTGFRTTGTAGNFQYADFGMGLLNYSYSAYNQRTHLIRLHHFVSGNAGFYRFVGEPPGLRAVSMAPFQALEEYTIGSDVWKIFPLIKKGSITLQEDSGNYGIAYKKVL